MGQSGMCDDMLANAAAMASAVHAAIEAGWLVMVYARPPAPRSSATLGPGPRPSTRPIYASIR
jgi:hypothetical protein